MFYRPEIIVFLWMLPVLAMIVLPALWRAAALCLRSAERSRLGDVQGFIDLGGTPSGSDFGVERRETHRVRVDECRARASGRIHCCGACVVNISAGGICLADIHGKLPLEEETSLLVVFRTRQRDYHLSVIPRWKEREGGSLRLGGEIVAWSRGWREFAGGFGNQQPATA